MDESFNHSQKRWRFKEQKRLYDAYISGANVVQCSELCDRSVGSIETMLQKMGLVNEGGQDVFPRPEFKYRGREYVPRQSSASRPRQHKPDGRDQLLSELYPETTISELLHIGLIDVRAYNVLSYNDYKTAHDLLKTSDNTFLRYPNFGRHSLRQVTRIKSYLENGPPPDSQRERPAATITTVPKPLTKEPILTETIREDMDFIASMIDAFGADERARRILKARLGIGVEQGIIKLQDLGNEFGVSRERIRQIESKTLKRLRGYIRRKYSLPPRYDAFLDSEFFAQYDLLHDLIGSGTLRVLAKLVYIFDPTQKDLREIEKKAETAIQRYFLALRDRELPQKEIYSQKERFISEQLLGAISAISRQPVDLFQWIKDARIVQEWEFSGLFPSEKMGKDIQFESHAERAVLRTLEKMPEVEWYDVQCIQFDYTVKDKKFTYHPDIISRLNNGQVVIVEVKPAMTMALLKTFTKAMAAKKYCDENGWHYVILSPNDGAIENMVRWSGPTEIEKKFVETVEGKLITDYEGIRWEQIKDFMLRHELDYRDLTAIALRNDLAFREFPYRCGKLPAGLSWSEIIPVLRATDRSHINRERERITKQGQ